MVLPLAGQSAQALLPATCREAPYVPSVHVETDPVHAAACDVCPDVGPNVDAGQGVHVSTALSQYPALQLHSAMLSDPDGLIPPIALHAVQSGVIPLESFHMLEGHGALASVGETVGAEVGAVVVGDFVGAVDGDIVATVVNDVTGPRAVASCDETQLTVTTPAL